MPLLKKINCYFDTAHNEMLNIDEDDFSEFANLLQRLGFKIIKGENKELDRKVLQDIDVLLIGNPISSYFSNVEIKTIVDFIREGGNLLVLSEYGSDYLQKTNLNDLLGTNFGIFLEKNIIKEESDNNQDCSSIISIQKFQQHKITNNLREIIIGGSCSFLLNRLAKPLISTNGNNFWSEEYNSMTEQWIKDESLSTNTNRILAAYREYGRGKILAFGDIDIITNDPNIGINQKDNRKFITNAFNWLIEPIKESTIRFWALDQLGIFQNDIREMSNKINNLIESISLLEKRISVLEKTNGTN